MSDPAQTSNPQAIVAAFLTLAGTLLPLLGQAGTGGVNAILLGLETLIPMLGQVGPEMMQEVQAIVAAVQTSGAATAEQLTQAEAIAAQVDAGFAAAETAYNTTHP